MGFKKKLHKNRPDRMGLEIATYRTRDKCRAEPCDSKSIETGVRQLLADKVSGTMVGLWLLVPEHLRLGTWDLLCGWTKKLTSQVEPRLALQLVNEAALCVKGVRQTRNLSQKGFELANGLPFVATDQAIHHLLDGHTTSEAQNLQVALGRIRRASSHYTGKVIAIDPHRKRSYSKRQMRRHKVEDGLKPVKAGQTFFCFDVDGKQPVCFTTGTTSKTVTQATPELLDLAAAILGPEENEILAVADAEHFTEKLIGQLYSSKHFDLLVQQPINKNLRETLAIRKYIPRWVGFATSKSRYRLKDDNIAPLYQIIQRCGENPDDYEYKAFLSTADRDEVDDLTLHYPKRWHLEEFFNANQALGWSYAGTMNLNIRYAHMTMALIAQAAICQLRSRLGQPFECWDAEHLAKAIFQGLDGDIRVTHDTIIVTFYNAPNVDLLRKHYEELPEKLIKENIDPRIPWLYDFKLDFRFK